MLGRRGEPRRALAGPWAAVDKVTRWGTREKPAKVSRES